MSPTKVRNASRLKIRKQLQQFDFYNCEHVSPLSKYIRLSLPGFSPPPQNWPHQVNRIHSKQSDESKNSVIRRNKNQLKLLDRHWGLKGLCLRGITRRWQFVLLISWRLQLLQTLGEERSRWPLVIVLVRPFLRLIIQVVQVARPFFCNLSAAAPGGPSTRSQVVNGIKQFVLENVTD